MAMVFYLMPPPAIATADIPAQSVQSEARENERLREIVKQQEEEISELRARLAELTRRLADEGIAIAGSETVSDSEEGDGAAQNKVRTIIFVLEASGHMIGPLMNRTASTVVLDSIDDLEEGQTYNVLLHGSKGVTAMQPGRFLRPTPENRRRAETFLRVSGAGEPRPVDAVLFALRSRPDMIWVIGTGHVDDHEAALKTIREANRGRTRINTTVRFISGSSPERRHFLWKLAQENGGTCIDANGEAIDEPVVPVTVVDPPPPAPRRPVGLPLN